MLDFEEYYKYVKMYAEVEAKITYYKKLKAFQLSSSDIVALDYILNDLESLSKFVLDTLGDIVK